jgi:ribosome biogenesis GTPase
VSGRVRIDGLLARRTRFVRKIPGDVTEQQVVAANIDTVFVVMGCDADFNLRRLERYLVLARESGAEPLILLNKADKADEPDALEGEIETTVRDVRVHLLSAKTGLGFDELAEELHPGQTIALLGSSGVGKSTIVNRLAGEDLLPTREVREHDERGRHTTRHRQLVLLSNGAMLIDSPGMRELQLWEASEGFAAAFEDIEALSEGCRFRDCTHRSEPGCNVRQAVEKDELPASRLVNYLKLADERRQLERRLEEKRWGTRDTKPGSSRK